MWPLKAAMLTLNNMTGNLYRPHKEHILCCLCFIGRLNASPMGVNTNIINPQMCILAAMLFPLVVCGEKATATVNGRVTYFTERFTLLKMFY